MSIADFIRDSVLRPRLAQAGTLVVYDHERRYRELCLELASEAVTVADASTSGIEARRAALRALRALGQSQTGPAGLAGLLIYVPARAPQSDEQKLADPFAVYGACGAVFPQGDGDEYLSLCLRARPDHAAEIRQLFASNPGGPAFAVLDAIGSGAHWPQLRASLGVESAREILVALLAPSAAQLDALKQQEGWLPEARGFLHATLGLTLKTRSKSWSALADELWRYVLFSEFAFDLPGALPGALPAALQGVPHAPEQARSIALDVCERLRGSARSRPAYIERAQAVQDELRLVEHCAGIDDLGERDTFPFEERTFLRQAIKGLVSGDTDAARRVLAARQTSVWQSRGESLAQWELMRAGLNLVEACDDLERQLPEHARTQAELLDFYLLHLREADRLQREFEQAAGDFLDTDGLLREVTAQARGRYRRQAEKVQGVFMKHLEASGWPPPGRLANAEVFDRLVTPSLKDSGRRLAYLMVDALRYELGVALERMLAEDGPVQLHAAYAQLPTITPVGMASLLPGARGGLALGLDSGALLPRLGDAAVGNVAQRMALLAQHYGDRFAQLPLADFVRGKGSLAETVDLLVLRSTEIDSQLENNPETTLGLIPATLRLIRAALHKLRGLGFSEAVIVTDHGFFLNGHAEAGDVCQKPQGQWLNMHDRLMLGDGLADSHNLVMGAARLGIAGDFAQAALPRSMAPYRAGHLYFHGGASLAEAVVPVLVARLEPPDGATVSTVQVELSYRNGARRITTLLPVIEVSLVADLLSQQDCGVDILLEAQDTKGKVVGEPRSSGEVNPATRTITLRPGQRKQIALRMDEDFRGKFKVRALDPKTLALASKGSELALETDYTE